MSWLLDELLDIPEEFGLELTFKNLLLCYLIANYGTENDLI